MAEERARTTGRSSAEPADGDRRPPRPPGAPGGVTEARVVAAEVCADMRAGELLDPAFERRAGRLDARDRRWTQELLWGMLRRRSWLDAVLAARVRGGLARLDADVADLLRLGTAQLLYMGSVPAYAAIAQTVELAKRRHGMGAGGLVNAVLRRVDRERAELGVALPHDPIDRLALVHSHPRWLVQRWVERWGEAEAERLLQANNEEAPVVVRPYGVVREQLETMLEAAGVVVAEVPLARDSLRLSGTGALTELGAFRQGLFFMQDPASTLVTDYAAVPAGATVADLCAAPGGKALELARTAGLVVAADRSWARLQRVVANLRRLDARTVYPLVADARQPAIAPVDVVLIDVPCTGTGTFRRHPDARWRLKPSDLAVMPALQRSILQAAADVVKPGGLLVYSTCSLEPEENDAQVDAFLAAAGDAWAVEPPPAGSVPAEVLDGDRLRVLPHRHGTDGAFAVRLRRTHG
ncbi:MAG TPA: 16S rRNA (cytosine(967)-C(5))-methyltransferase RsmB [Gemmatimonadaceae bacterium]|nr:16S rRNA (cytosine(967)-C(5))-methyltransferase RsmB [Gemmatimonadaceae bacterium]